MQDCLKLEETILRKALNTIRKTYCTNGDKSAKPPIPTTKIWINKFLFHQNRLPLDMSDINSRKTHYLIESNFVDFGKPEAMSSILETTIGLQTKGKKAPAKPKTPFVTPTWEQFHEYYLSIGETDENEIANVFDHYKSVGWKVGKKPMADWKAAIDFCYRNKYKGNKGYTVKKSKTEILEEESKKTLMKISELNENENEALE